MSDDALTEAELQELEALRKEAARLLRQLDLLHAQAPPRLTREQIARKHGISVWDVREIERIAILKAQRAAARLLTEDNQP